MIRRHDLDVALSYTVLDSLRLVASGSTSIPVNHEDLLLSLKLIRRHNLFFPLILTEAGRLRLKEEEALLSSDVELARPASDRSADNDDSAEAEAHGSPLLQSRCRYLGGRSYFRMPRR